jgi:hypothetical protein
MKQQIWLCIMDEGLRVHPQSRRSHPKRRGADHAGLLPAMVLLPVMVVAVMVQQTDCCYQQQQH